MALVAGSETEKLPMLGSVIANPSSEMEITAVGLTKQARWASNYRSEVPARCRHNAHHKRYSTQTGLKDLL